MSTTAEYDAFGPWIYEVRTAEEVPRLFRTYPLDLDAAILTIKVPRVIDRRDANPSMDLYDILLSLGPEKVTVLRRRGREYDFREVPYGELQGVSEVIDLLDGRLTLHADGGPVVVRFNGSSSEIVSHLVKLIRGLYVTAPPSDRPLSASPGGEPSLAEIERDLQLMHRRLRRENGAERIIAVQDRHAVVATGANAVSRAIARAWPTTLQSSIFSIGEQELQVLHRGKSFVTGFKPVHALARTLLPLERLSGVETRPNDDHPEVTTIGIRIGHVVHEFVADDGVAAAVRQRLRALMPR